MDKLTAALGGIFGILDDGVQVHSRCRHDRRGRRMLSSTGNTASCTISGSRRLFEKNPNAALFGGRMQIVGSRMQMPSKNPGRV